MLGTGTRQDPYLVSTEQDLNDIRNDIHAYYKLTNDIYLTEEWTPIPIFSGSIDGDGYTIFDLYINSPSESGIGFISYLDYGGLTSSPYRDAIKNLNFKDANIVGGSSTGIIAGRVRGEEYKFVDYFGKNYSRAQAVMITNCNVTGTIRSSSNGVGGLVGSTHSNVRPTDWDSNDMINLRIEDSHANIDIYAFGSNIGGMVGDATDGGITIYRSSTRGNIYNANQRVGGIVGYGGGRRTGGSNCYSLMNIQGSNYIGGMVGSTDYPHEYWVGGGIDGYFAGSFNVNDSSSTFIGVNVGYKEGIVNGGEKTSDFLYDAEKSQLSKFRRANIKGGIGKTTAEMMNPITYINHGFDITAEWYANESTRNDYLRLKSEFDSSLFELEGEGTEANPYLIKTVDHLVAVRDYDSRNWSEYIKQLSDENTFNHPNFKDGFNNFSPPRRYHYKLANDINLNVHPWNIVGWKPINNTLETSNNMFAQYNSIGEWIGVTSDYGRTFTDRSYVYTMRDIKRRGFMGVFDGGDHKIKNLKLTEAFVKNDYESDRISFFGVITNGTVKNIKFEGVTIESDSYRGLKSGYNRPIPRDNVISFATVANVVQTPATIDRVMVEGESYIYDHREDVGGTRASISGFIGGGTYTEVYDRDYGHGEQEWTNEYGTRHYFRGLKHKINITNSSVRIKHTTDNVDLNDNYYHFTPFINGANYMHIENCYSASSNHALDRFGNEIMSSIHSDRVIIQSIGNNVWYKTVTKDDPQHEDYPNARTTKHGVIHSIIPNSTIMNVYYDSEIVNATPNDVERELDINGRSTEAMYLVSTYDGWDFTRIWQSDGVSYPTLQPYDPNYTPPTNNTTHTVSSYIDGLYMMVDSFGEHKVLRTVVLNSKAKRFTGKTSTTKRGTNHMNTVILPLYTVAFEYVEPVVGERTVITEVIELNNHASATKSSRRGSTVTTALEEIETSVEADGVNRGAFFNAIEVVAIRTNSALVRLNDNRVYAIEMLINGEFTASFARSNESNYIVIPFEPSIFNDGDNNVELLGIDDVRNTLTTKTLNINKSIPSFRNQTGRYIVIDNEYYTITSHTNDGTITLDKNLPSNLLRRLGDNTFKTIELVEYTQVPQISIGGKGHEPNFKDGELIRVKNIGNEIEEEYEFNGEGEEVITKINFERELPATNATGGTDNSRENGIHIYEGAWSDGDSRHIISTLNNSDWYIEDIDSIKYLDGNMHQDTVGGYRNTQYQLIQIDVEKFVRRNINETYEHESSKHLDIKLRFYGHQRIKTAGQMHSGNDSAITQIRILGQDGSTWSVVDGVVNSNPTSRYVTEFDISGRNLSFKPTIYQEPMTGRNSIFLLIQMPMIMYQSGGSPSAIEYTHIFTDYIEVEVDAPEQNTEVMLINEVRQSFTPKYNNNKTI